MEVLELQNAAAREEMVEELLPIMRRYNALVSIYSGIIQLLREGRKQSGWDTLEYYQVNKEHLTTKDIEGVNKVIQSIIDEKIFKEDIPFSGIKNNIDVLISEIRSI